MLLAPDVSRRGQAGGWRQNTSMPTEVPRLARKGSRLSAPLASRAMAAVPQSRDVPPMPLSTA
jgi:hypothetical protein